MTGYDPRPTTPQLQFVSVVAGSATTPLQDEEPPGYVTYEPGEGCPAVQNVWNLATVTSLRSIANDPTRTPDCAGEAFKDSMVLSPCVYAPPGTSTKPHPGVPGTMQLRCSIQVPPVQVTPPAQTFPQAEQLWVSVCRFLQVPPQLVNPESQVEAGRQTSWSCPPQATHPAPTRTYPGLQVNPHTPVRHTGTPFGTFAQGLQLPQ